MFKRRFSSILTILCFGMNAFFPGVAHAEGLALPVPGTMVHLSPAATPAHLKGIVIHPEDPFKFDFIIHRGDTPLSDAQKKAEYAKLVKYFLASLAVPDEDQWVNLSPYEKDRVVQDNFGKTVMGRDLLAQDYVLKQITASLIYPEDSLGKKFWDKVYQESQAKYGTTNLPVNTFNKVWIMPDDALVYEKGSAAYVIKNHLKVMLEEDYLAASKGNHRQTNEGSSGKATEGAKLTRTIIRDIILPALEREVNEGGNFAALRQVYSGMLLAAWFKRSLKKTLLAQVYADKAKVRGVDQPACRQAGTRCEANEAIYERYLQAYKKGVFNLIKEDTDRLTQQPIPRKYFSGGAVNSYGTVLARGIRGDLNPDQDRAMTTELETQDDKAQVVLRAPVDHADADMERKNAADGAMAAHYPVSPWFMESMRRDNERMKKNSKKFAEAYKEHISNSSRFILEGAKGLHGTALLLGLGNGMEYGLPGLEALARQFDKIIVVDIDDAALRQTLADLDAYLVRNRKKPLSQKFEVRPGDLSGILGDFSHDIDAVINVADTPAAALAASIRVIQKFFDQERPVVEGMLQGRSADRNYEADYVVSSLLLSQLSSFLGRYISDAMSRKFSDFSPDRLMRDGSYLSAIAQLSQAIQVKHVLQLRGWVKPTGRVYFSDTTFEHTTVLSGMGVAGIRRAQRSLPMQPPLVWHVLSLLFDSSPKRQWYWHRIPPEKKATGSSYEVEGVILEPKPAAAADKAQVVLREPGAYAASRVDRGRVADEAMVATPENYRKRLIMGTSLPLSFELNSQRGSGSQDLLRLVYANHLFRITLNDGTIHKGKIVASYVPVNAPYGDNNLLIEDDQGALKELRWREIGGLTDLNSVDDLLEAPRSLEPVELNTGEQVPSFLPGLIRRQLAAWISNKGDLERRRIRDAVKEKQISVAILDANFPGKGLAIFNFLSNAGAFKVVDGDVGSLNGAFTVMQLWMKGLNAVLGGGSLDKIKAYLKANQPHLPKETLEGFGIAQSDSFPNNTHPDVLHAIQAEVGAEGILGVPEQGDANVAEDQTPVKNPRELVGGRGEEPSLTTGADRISEGRIFQLPMLRNGLDEELKRIFGMNHGMEFELKDGSHVRGKVLLAGKRQGMFSLEHYLYLEASDGKIVRLEWEKDISKIRDLNPGAGEVSPPQAAEKVLLRNGNQVPGYLPLVVAREYNNFISHYGSFQETRKQMYAAVQSGTYPGAFLNEFLIALTSSARINPDILNVFKAGLRMDGFMDNPLQAQKPESEARIDSKERASRVNDIFRAFRKYDDYYRQPLTRHADTEVRQTLGMRLPNALRELLWVNLAGSFVNVKIADRWVYSSDGLEAYKVHNEPAQGVWLTNDQNVIIKMPGMLVRVFMPYGSEDVMVERIDSGEQGAQRVMGYKEIDQKIDAIPKDIRPGIGFVDPREKMLPGRLGVGAAGKIFTYDLVTGFSSSGGKVYVAHFGKLGTLEFSVIDNAGGNESVAPEKLPVEIRRDLGLDAAMTVEDVDRDFAGFVSAIETDATMPNLVKIGHLAQTHVAFNSENIEIRHRAHTKLTEFRMLFRQLWAQAKVNGEGGQNGDNADNKQQMKDLGFSDEQIAVLEQGFNPQDYAFPQSFLSPIKKPQDFRNYTMFEVMARFVIRRDLNKVPPMPIYIPDFVTLAEKLSGMAIRFKDDTGFSGGFEADTHIRYLSLAGASHEWIMKSLLLNRTKIGTIIRSFNWDPSSQSQAERVVLASLSVFGPQGYVHIGNPQNSFQIELDKYRHEELVKNGVGKVLWNLGYQYDWNKPEVIELPYEPKLGDLDGDKAMASDYGGIDMNSANLNLRIKRDGGGMPLPLAQQDLAQFSNLQGLEPRILAITPASRAVFAGSGVQP